MCHVFSKADNRDKSRRSSFKMEKLASEIQITRVNARLRSVGRQTESHKYNLGGVKIVEVSEEKDRGVAV